MTEGKQKMEKVMNSPKDNILKGDLTNDSRFQSVYGKLLNCMYDVVIIYDNEKINFITIQINILIYLE